MAETAESVAASLTEDEAEESLTELLGQLGREPSALVFYEARLAASRHKPELRRAASGVAATLVVALAFLAAFALANATAVRGLSPALSDWLAPLRPAPAATRGASQAPQTRQTPPRPANSRAPRKPGSRQSALPELRLYQHTHPARRRTPTGPRRRASPPCSRITTTQCRLSRVDRLTNTLDTHASLTRADDAAAVTA